MVVAHSDSSSDSSDSQHSSQTKGRSSEVEEEPACYGILCGAKEFIDDAAHDALELGGNAIDGVLHAGNGIIHGAADVADDVGLKGVGDLANNIGNAAEYAGADVTQAVGTGAQDLVTDTTTAIAGA